MNLEQITTIISKLHAGASYVVVYKAKAWLADGKTEIEKIVRRPVRLGVRYAHLKHMQGHQPGALPGNGRWVIDRYVYQDNNGYKLRITNGAFGKAKSKFYMNGAEIDAAMCWHSNKKHASIVQCVCLENLISIEKKGEAI